MKSAKRSECLEWALVAGLGAVICLAGTGRRVNPFDEGLVVVASERVLNGELPFRDFFPLYPPGQYYAVAALFGLFGPAIITVRLYCVAVRTLIALLIYLSTRKLAGRMPAAACWGAGVLWLASYKAYGYPTFPALLLVLLSLVILASCVDEASTDGRRSNVRLGLAGGALGAAALFRHDLGAYGLLASLPSLVALMLRPTSGAAGASRRRSVEAARRGSPYFAGLICAFGVPAAWFLTRVPIREVIFALFTYPSTMYIATRRLPFPPLFLYPFTRGVLGSTRMLLKNFHNLAFYSPLLFYSLGLVRVAAQIRRRGREGFRDPDILRFAGIVLFGAMAYNLGRVRMDALHGIATVVPSYVVAMVLVKKAVEGSDPWRRVAAAGLTGVVLLSLTAPAASMPHPSLDGLRSALGAYPTRAGCLDAGPARHEAAVYLRSVVPPGGRIFVGCSRHDLVFINETIIYFLAERLPGSRYHSLDPGITTTLEAQREIVAGLVRYRVEFIALSSEFENSGEANLSSVSSGVTFLDDYIHSHYQAERRFGPFITIWKRSAGWERGDGHG
ncbi:MAG TPA: hypothetical protein VFT43_15840 [Candidatus Polarisedimenticolia bacterium]|nr:hypothetical protein [Candidatus Polarisedimenticolia bacterium]